MIERSQSSAEFAGAGDRPATCVVLAMSADGKIADQARTAARFGSPADQQHLEAQLAAVDGVMFGAGTLRAYGTTLRVRDTTLLSQRAAQGKLPQPIHLVVSGSGQLDPEWRFFQQTVPRWLLTLPGGDRPWRGTTHFERVLVMPQTPSGVDWGAVLQQLRQLGLTRLAVVGGGALVASLLAQDAIDELWLTVCPLLLGGTTAPTPVGGTGFLQTLAPRLTLQQVRSQGDEVFLHYRVNR